MTKDEALKLALEAWQTSVYGSESHHKAMLFAMTNLAQALAATTQEPRCAVIVEVFGKDWRLDYMSLPVGKHRLYTQQYIYTTPPQRTWVGLTEDEIVLVIAECAASHKHMDIHLSRAIEAKLKEKNT